MIVSCSDTTMDRDSESMCCRINKAFDHQIIVFFLLARFKRTIASAYVPVAAPDIWKLLPDNMDSAYTVMTLHHLRHKTDSHAC